MVACMVLLQLAQVCMSCNFGIMGHRPQGAHGLMLCRDNLLQITHDMLNIHDHDMIYRHQPRLMAHLSPNGGCEVHTYHSIYAYDVGTCMLFKCSKCIAHASVMPLLCCADILQYKVWAGTIMTIMAVTGIVLNTCTYTCTSLSLGNARFQLAMQLWKSSVPRNAGDGGAVSVA